jgi:cell division septum initiation protein DivIVA
MDTRNGHGWQQGPSDREIVALLQRLASARAQLLQAEHAATGVTSFVVVAARNNEIEDAHAEMLWAQAQLLTGQRESRAQRLLEQARDRERQVLRRCGFGSFRDYLVDRTSTPTTDIHLDVARREYDSAQAGWRAIQQAIGQAPPDDRTVIDLRGGHPRRIA